MEYITTKEASAKWGISTIRITVLANEGRIPGAQRLGRSWLIPATATKPPELKACHSGSARKKTFENNDFSFPLYHFRPDWSDIKESHLNAQQRGLLQAEAAVLECRFADAYLLLESILRAPDDPVTESGCLLNAGICCIALNRPDDFSRIYLRLQALLSGDVPHRNDLAIIFDCLNTYVATLESIAASDTCNTDIHSQCLPLMCMMTGYTQLAKEAMVPDSADTTMLELMLRLLQNTSAVIIEMLRMYLLGIYSLRGDMAAAKKHAELAVQIAYENKLYFPLVTYYPYNAPLLSPILKQYPKEFRNHCNSLISQYETNSSDFFAAISEHPVISNLNDSDSPYINAVLMGFSNALIAEKLGVSQHTVNRRLTRLCENFGVSSKKELREYLHKYM